jgi:hypothetical protein
MPSAPITEESFKLILSKSIADPTSQVDQLKGFVAATATTDLEIRIKEQSIVRLGEIYKQLKY